MTRAFARMERREMPLLRYFVFVGGALLALLFIADSFFPKEAVVTAADSGIDKSTIRIHSDRKWPERVVFDTNRPTNLPAAAANTIASAQVPAATIEAHAQTRVRDSFAQLRPPEKQAQLTEPKKPENPKPRKRTIAKRHVGPPVMLAAQQPQQFGLFGNSTW
jgi:hypothetical protein